MIPQLKDIGKENFVICRIVELKPDCFVVERFSSGWLWFSSSWNRDRTCKLEYRPNIDAYDYSDDFDVEFKSEADAQIYINNNFSRPNNMTDEQKDIVAKGLTQMFYPEEMFER